MIGGTLREVGEVDIERATGLIHIGLYVCTHTGVDRDHAAGACFAARDGIEDRERHVKVACGHERTVLKGMADRAVERGGIRQVAIAPLPETDRPVGACNGLVAEVHREWRTVHGIGACRESGDNGRCHRHQRCVCCDTAAPCLHFEHHFIDKVCIGGIVEHIGGR